MSQAPSAPGPAAHAKHLEHELTWLRTVYQGDDAPQLTRRALVTGFLIGGIMSLSNVYVSLKIGWSMGVSITSCILAFAAFSAFNRIGLIGTNLSALENYTAQSVATAAASASSAGLSSAVPALYMVTGRWVGGWELAIWISAISFLGVSMAIPMKRQMINIEQLKFPDAIATAETLRSLYSRGSGAAKKARALVGAGGLGAVVAWFRDATFAWMPFTIPQHLYPPLSIRGIELSKLTLGFEGSLIMVAAGAIMGMRVAVSMLLGALINYAIIAPRLIESGIVPPSGGFRAISAGWSVWPGVAVMLSASMLSFAFQWRTIARAFGSLGQMFGGAAETEEDPLARVEVPNSWFVTGFLVAGAACVALQMALFGISWWMAIFAVLMTFFLALVASRAAGETNIAPLGPLGKITQLMNGVLAPGNPAANLMTANVTGGCAAHASDLLTDLKCGYLIGANPRRQFLAQFFGVVAGSLFAVPAYQLIVTPQTLGSDALPAPAARMWAAVAQAFVNGLDSLHTSARYAIAVALILGAVMALLERFFPRLKPWMPSATGLGISFVIGGYNSISMFIGASIVYLVSRLAPKVDEDYTIPVSSGIIAGESLMGVLLAGLAASGIMKA